MALRGVRAIFLLATLAGCGGGGGGGSPQGMSVSPQTLTFTAATPQSERPPSQTVTATLTGVDGGGATLFVRIEIAGLAVASVTNVTVINSSQGTASVNPASPAALGPGTHTSVITVKMCTTDASCSGAQLPGSPKTVNVTYNVGTLPPPPAAVAPSVATAGILGDVIIRGNGFTTGSVVMFGGTTAAVTSVFSDTEIRATHPALAAGVYPVEIVPATGSPFLLGKSLTVVDPPGYATTLLAYPTAPERARGLAYDPVAKALLVSVKHTNTANNQLLRYAFASGAWPTPASVTLADLRDIALSLDGATLFAVTEAALLELNPATLATLKTTPRPMNTSTLEERLKGVALANDGNVVVTTGLRSGFTGHSRFYLYSPAASTFTSAQVTNSFSSFYHAVAGAPANGAFVNILQGGLSPAQPVHRYDASSRSLVAASFALDHWKLFGLQENTNVPAFDRAGTRMIAPEAGVYSIFDEGFVRYGSLPATTVAYALAPDAVRAYAMTLESGVCRVRAFDLAGATAGSPAVLGELSTAVLPATITCPTSGAPTDWKMVVTPADDTAFIAGELGIAVVRLR